MYPKISIIIPVYNIERYVRACIESALGQSYPNFELLLVDDGSTDTSGDICNQYLGDGRVSVIHKSNGGLSDARNTGLDRCSGDFVTFIDGDDTVSSCYLKYLYELQQREDADISVCGMTKVGEPVVGHGGLKTSRNPVILNGQMAIEEMLYAKIFSCSAGAKLYKAALFDEIRYPINRYSEDMFTTWKVFEQTDCVAVGFETHYFYFNRPGSILASSFNEKHLDLFEALDEIRASNDELNNTSSFMRAYSAQYISAVGETLEKNPPLDVIRCRGIWAESKKLRNSVIFDDYATKRNRAFALLSYFGPRIERVVLAAYYGKFKWGN